jgi:hypothetical protein
MGVFVKFSVCSPRLGAFAALLLSVGVLVSAGPTRADAATPAHTDVMFVFDTTGSMEGALTEAKAQIQEAMTQIGASLPDVQFGLADMRDYNEVNNPGIFEYGIEEGYEPWTLKVPITPNQSVVASEILNLFAAGGGDGPESYGRALFESSGNPAVGWRAGARGVIVLVADNVPHDTELNDGIPSDVWADEPPFDTGMDPGADNTVGTGDDLDWQSVVLPKLISDGKPLEYVDYFGDPELFPYWQNWAGRTGGSALEASSGNLVSQIVELVKAGASAPLPACPSGQVRDSNEHCVTPALPPPPPSNFFKFEPRISCAKGCHVVLVKITFDSAGNVIGESIPEEEKAASSATISKKKACKKAKGKCKRPALIKKLSQPVTAGANTLKLKLTGQAIKTLKKKGKLKLKVSFTFTPDGGSPRSEAHTYKVTLPKKGKKKGHAKGK